MLKRTKIIIGAVLCVIPTAIVFSDLSDNTNFIEYVTCEPQGGIMISHGGKFSVCALPTTDTGMECSDSSQCQGHCDAKPDAQWGNQDIGLCSEYDKTYSCFNHVRNGTVTGRICY